MPLPRHCVPDRVHDWPTLWTAEGGQGPSGRRGTGQPEIPQGPLLGGGRSPTVSGCLESCVAPLVKAARHREGGCVDALVRAPIAQRKVHGGDRPTATSDERSLWGRLVNRKCPLTTWVERPRPRGLRGTRHPRLATLQNRQRVAQEERRHRAMRREFNLEAVAASVQEEIVPLEVGFHPRAMRRVEHLLRSRGLPLCLGSQAPGEDGIACGHDDARDGRQAGEASQDCPW